MVEVDFGPNERLLKPYDLLEPVEPEEDMLDLLAMGRCSGPIDLRRVLTLAKVKGGLTNVFYSMEASNTDFYPHQFKPVLRFIESTTGRLLIADEVGLGKTIESIYIWKELQAREDARRLLIIVPAMLRQKWQDDLQRCFGISAEIIRSRELVEKVARFSERRLINHTFTLITSLEGLRTPSDFNDEDNTSARAAFGRLLDRNTATDNLALFDLTIIDEAHYLRNPQTASNRLGRLVRDASRNLVLLTATPIQIKTGNLYELLRLVDEEQFSQGSLFEEILQANAPIIRALRSIWRIPPEMDIAREGIAEALANRYFTNDPVLGRVATQISSETYDAAARVELGRLLESRSLLGQYMTRSRKREVLKRRVERAAQVLHVSFSSQERLVYNTITRKIRERMAKTEGMATLALCTRQRQMTSCLVAALERWREWDLIEEVMSEDIGSSFRQDNADMDQEDAHIDDELLSEEIVADVDIRDLERVDSKYLQLRMFLRKELSERPADKIVMFSFFRGTLAYLQRRLEQDGLQTALIMGGMGDEKQNVLRRFASASGPSILLSSEIGSEGIDLQFCRLVVNYDLPWNPMRVEQRIGRLDRLGQTADKISIVNLALQDTIEDKILLRLYDRIDLFKDSIGDLEEILGEITEQLMLKLLAPNLTDEQRETLAQESELAILNKRTEQERLERDAVNLIGFTDHILDNVRETRELGRWISGDELMAFMDDFFARYYAGTQISRLSDDPMVARVNLSTEARADLAAFIRTSRPIGATGLHQRISNCLFDPRQSERFDTFVERVDATHPLIQWICDRLRSTAPYPVSAADLCCARTNVGPGMYTFVVHRWEFTGLRERRVLSFRVADLVRNHVLDGKSSEMLVVTASQYGTMLSNVGNAIGDLDLMAAIDRCNESLNSEYAQLLEDFKAENEQRCNAQETSAQRFSDRRIRDLEDRLRRFRDNNQLHLIPMTEGLVRRERAHLAANLKKVGRRRITDSTMDPLAVGIVRVR